MKNILFFFLILFGSHSLICQQQINFSFAESPQTLLLNPGAETNFEYHYGLPLLNNFRLHVGTTNFTLESLFVDDGRSFTDKLSAYVLASGQNEHVNLNLRNDLLYGGFRLNPSTYLSFGFYQEFDFTFSVPNDVLELGLFGNDNFLNRSFQLSQINLKGSITGVLHAGISKKVNERLNVGVRAKIYSSSASIESTANSGTFRTFNSNENIIRQTINNLDGEVRTSGIVNESDEFLENPEDLFGNTFFGGNFGLGFDVGFTYHFAENLEFTASLLDIGFVRYNQNVRTYSAEGDFVFDGIEFEYDPDNPRDYWGELEDEFDEKINLEESQNAYTSLRPMRINAALRYSFGDVRPVQCFTATRKSYYSNAIGFQTHSILRPLNSEISFTSFFETSFSQNFHVKLTHTFNKYSNAIFGAGLAFQWRTLNFLGSIDNITRVASIETANTMALNFGINFVIK